MLKQAVSLLELKIGEIVRIIGYRAIASPLRQQLLAMGFVPGTFVRLVRRAPFGDPLEIECRGYTLSIRQADADFLQLERSEALPAS